MATRQPLGDLVRTGNPSLDVNGKSVEVTNHWQQSFLNRFYPPEHGWVDGTTEFHAMCRRVMPHDAVTLEVGAGGTNNTSRFLRGTSRVLVGLDIDPAVQGNRHLNHAVVYGGTQFPFKDSGFDVVISDYVNEHLRDPERICSEINRVLRPRGIYLFRTPNIYHYVAALSSFLPKRLANWARNKRDGAHDPYPTYYRLNSASKCRRILGVTGFDIVELNLIEKEPSYGMRSPLLFYPLMCYERVVNSSELFHNFRANIPCAARKRSSRS